MHLENELKRFLNPHDWVSEVPQVQIHLAGLSNGLCPVFPTMISVGKCMLSPNMAILFLILETC